MIRSEILATGMFVPKNLIKNDDLPKALDTSDEWIRQRTGIEQRYWVDANTSTSDLAVEACNKALSNAKVDKSEIDMIIAATLSPDHEFPGLACFVQKKLASLAFPLLIFASSVPVLFIQCRLQISLSDQARIKKF